MKLHKTRHIRHQLSHALVRALSENYPHYVMRSKKWYEAYTSNGFVHIYMKHQTNRRTIIASVEDSKKRRGMFRGFSIKRWIYCQRGKLTQQWRTFHVDYVFHSSCLGWVYSQTCSEWLVRASRPKRIYPNCVERKMYCKGLCYAIVEQGRWMGKGDGMFCVFFEPNSDAMMCTFMVPICRYICPTSITISQRESLSSRLI